MEILTHEDYVKDPRIACKYGRKCYQKNPVHHTKYKHPPTKRQGDENVQNDRKRHKVDNNGESSNSELNNVDKSEDAVQKTNETLLKTGEDGTQTKEEIIEISKTITSEKTESQQIENTILKDFDKKEFIKSKFLVDMPEDFYKFYGFCCKLNTKNPSLALRDVGLLLVGPFDVLSGKFDGKPELKKDDYLIHWRFFHDPPEFQTVLIENSSQYHIGYFRDEPAKNPVFLAENYASKNGSFSIVGDNIFAAVYNYLNNSLKSASPFQKMSIHKIINLIRNEAKDSDYDLSEKSPLITKRNRNVIARSFNSLGMVVPYERKSELGYRPLAMSNRELKVLLEKICKCSDKERGVLMSELQPVLTYASIATDECDFGTGLELGLDLLYYDTSHFNLLIKKYLSIAYNLLNRGEFAQIAEAHMNNRKKGKDLSVI